MDVGVDGEDMLGGQLVLPPDFDWPALLHVEEWTGVLPFISLQLCGTQLRMQLLLELQHANAILGFAPVCPVRLEALQNRQGIYVPFQRSRSAVWAFDCSDARLRLFGGSSIRE